MSQIIEGVYKQAGQPDQYIPIQVDEEGSVSTTANKGVNLDAGGRLRVSQLTSLFDGKTIGSDDPLVFENVGTGTATYANNKVTLSCTSGQYIVRRSKKYLPYFSGKSQQIEITFDGFGLQTGVIKRVGYFSSSPVAPYDTALDGFFLENDGTTVSLQCWRNGVNTLNLPWTSWSNYSNISSYNWNNFSVIVFDYLWLGGTELRLFLKTDDGFVLAHTFKWASNFTDTFIQSPNQCVRYSVSGVSASGSMRVICSSVSTEGEVTLASKSLSLYNTTPITVNTVGTIYALKSIKKLAAFRDTSISINSLGIVNTSNTDQGLMLLIVNPTLSAALTYVTNGKISEGTATNQTVTTGTGRVISADPASLTGVSSSLTDNYLASIGMSINNVSDEYVLCYIPATSNQSVVGTIAVREH
jgi:hypothetical protein